MRGKLRYQQVAQFGRVGALFLVGGNPDRALTIMTDFDPLFSGPILDFGNVANAQYRAVVAAQRQVANFIEITKRAASFDIEAARAAGYRTCRNIGAAHANGVGDRTCRNPKRR